MPRPWRMYAWSPRCSTHGALRWISKRIRASRGSTPLAGKCRSFKLQRLTGRFEADSVVRRPLLIRRTGAFVGLHAGEPVRDGLEFGLQRLNFLILPEHHIAQFRGGAFQEGDLGLDLLQSLVVHPRSLARIQ